MTSKRFTVELHLTYTVEAESPDSALHAILPVVGDAKDVTYTVRELPTLAQRATPTSADRYAHLDKAAYKAAEVSEILGLSRTMVYQQLKYIRIGSRRLYPRATIIDVLENGVQREEPPLQTTPRYTKRSSHVSSPKIVHADEQPQERRRRAGLTMKEAASILRISPPKAKELFDQKKIYANLSYGTRTLERSAIEHYLNGGTPRQYVEQLIERAEHEELFKDDPEMGKEIIAKFRAEWPEDA